MTDIKYTELIRLNNETEEEYIWRIGNLIKDEQLPQWREIADEINRQLRTDSKQYDESKYRKDFQIADRFSYIFKRMYGSTDVNTESYIKTLEERERAIRKERNKLQATKLELYRNERQADRFELFYELVADKVKELEPPQFNIPSDENCKLNDYDDTNGYLIAMGDIHYGANFKSKNNVFSREECVNRFDYALQEISKFVRRNYIPKVSIVNVADSIQGLLRYKDLQINDIAVVDCVCEIADIIANFLNTLSKCCKIDYYHVPCANHSQTRPLGSKASEIASEDLEKVIIHIIERSLTNNENVNVICQDKDQGYLKIDMFDFNIVALHGHQIKNVNTCLSDLSMLHNTLYDYVILGHRHGIEEKTFNEGKTYNKSILTCPSFVGSDPYADSLFVGCKGGLKIYKFDKVNGYVGHDLIVLN